MFPRAQCPPSPARPLPPVVTAEELARTLRETREGLQRLRASLRQLAGGAPKLAS